jgi:anti-sigma B factor antagonist
MPMGEVTTETSGSPPSPVVVVISGEVDLAMAPAMNDHIAAALSKDSDLIVDLSAATFIDSVALGVLTLALERCEDAGHKLFMVISDARVLRVFELTGLTSSFAIFDSRAALSAHLDEAGGPDHATRN